VVPGLYRTDYGRAKGLEKQIDIVHAWLYMNQGFMQWNGVFDQGSVLAEFDNHFNRSTKGKRDTWCWGPDAGWVNEVGQQSHQLLTMYLRSGRYEYFVMGETAVRGSTDVLTIHHHNPAVKGAESRVGLAHGKGMGPWDGTPTHAAMPIHGAIDYYYLTGDERMRDVLDVYAKRCAADGLAAPLVRLWEATGNNAYKAAAMPKLLSESVKKRVLKPAPADYADLFPSLFFQEQILQHKPTRELLVRAARDLPVAENPLAIELLAWAWLKTKDEELMNRLFTAYQELRIKKAGYAAGAGDVWRIHWWDARHMPGTFGSLRFQINHVPEWYVQTQANLLQVGRYPTVIRALVEGGKIKDQYGN
jgi:hypothetical protein